MKILCYMLMEIFGKVFLFELIIQDHNYHPWLITFTYYHYMLSCISIIINSSSVQP